VKLSARVAAAGGNGDKAQSEKHVAALILDLSRVSPVRSRMRAENWRENRSDQNGSLQRYPKFEKLFSARPPHRQLSAASISN
jgi:hypothetical protein